MSGRLRSAYVGAALVVLFSVGSLAAGGPGVASASHGSGFLAIQAPTVASPFPSCVAAGSCSTPTQFLTAYDLAGPDASLAIGTGATIALIDSFGSPTIAKDLAVFDAKFGLPAPPSLKIIAPAGRIPRCCSTSDMAGWAGETTLDVEWAHAMAPGARILLVETPVSETEGTAGFPQIVTALNYVLDHKLASVISMSFGATEATIPSSAWKWLHQPIIKAVADHVTLVASSGDTGATDYQLNMTDLYTHSVVGWPASDPGVTAVGGTYLKLGSDGTRIAADVLWNDLAGAGGGGLSRVWGRPMFQNGVKAIVGTHRGLPDISMSAAVQPGGVVFYHSYPGDLVGWDVVGGTSESAPLFAGLVARAVGLRAGHTPVGFINSWLYAYAKNPALGIIDVTHGRNTFAFQNSNGGSYRVIGFPARVGYDLVSGWGTVDGWKFVQALAKKA